MNISARSKEIANSFGKYVNTGNKSLIENFNFEEIEFALLQYYADKGCPHYEAMKRRIDELKEEAKPLTMTKELEQKFRILLSPQQEQKDFDNWRAEAKKLSYSIGILFIDIDHFKVLNERYTETKVDETILPQVQNLLRQLTDQRGGAYRHGGEEFVVIIPNHDREEVTAFAEKVRVAFERQKLCVDDSDTTVTVSIGVAVWPDHGNEFSEVLAAANKAEHLAKNGGRNAVRVAN